MCSEVLFLCVTNYLAEADNGYHYSKFAAVQI